MIFDVKDAIIIFPFSYSLKMFFEKIFLAPKDFSKQNLIILIY